MGIVGGGVGRVIQKPSRPGSIDNHYVIGSGVGAKSKSVHRALKKRANNNAKGLPCCYTKFKKEYKFDYNLSYQIDVNRMISWIKTIMRKDETLDVNNPKVAFINGTLYKVYVNVFSQVALNAVGDGSLYNVNNTLRTNNNPDVLQYNLSNTTCQSFQESLTFPSGWSGIGNVNNNEVNVVITIPDCTSVPIRYVLFIKKDVVTNII